MDKTDKKKMTVTFDDCVDEITNNEKQDIENIENIVNIENIEKIENEKINLEDYELSSEDCEFGTYFDLINIFNVYYKTKYNKNHSANLFDGIDVQDDTSTNRALEIFFNEITNYKNAEKAKKYDFITLYDETEYSKMKESFPEDTSVYNVIVTDSESEKIHKKVTHNLITAMLFIAEFDWINCEWSIMQIDSV